MAIRFGRFISAFAVFLVSAVAVICTINNAFHSGNQSPEEMLVFLQTYIGVISIITLCLSVLSHERSEIDRSRLAVQKQLYDIIEFLPDEHSIDANGCITMPGTGHGGTERCFKKGYDR
jgi:uncharacterized membrane protein